MNKNKVIFFTTWILLLAIAPITVFKNTPPSLLLDQNLTTDLKIRTGISILQRLAGLWAFTLISVQIFLGAFMTKLTEKLGGWVFRFHLTEGALAYILILAHPLLFVFLNFRLTGKIDPFYVFTDFCVICKNNLEYFYTLGRLSFWLITIAVTAAKLRTQPWLQNHWRKLHVLNYAAFLFIAIHSWNVGTDTHTAPFVWFYWFAVSVVIISLLYRRVYSILKIYKPNPAKI